MPPLEVGENIEFRQFRLGRDLSRIRIVVRPKAADSRAGLGFLHHQLEAVRFHRGKAEEVLVSNHRAPPDGSPEAIHSQLHPVAPDPLAQR